ncbi:MAG: hypothetical protein ACNA8P_08320, partial [Phycisphaerales bacterium]
MRISLGCVLDSEHRRIPGRDTPRLDLGGGAWAGDVHGVDIEDYTLVQEEAVTGEKLPTRYAWIVDPGTDKQSVAEVANIPSILSVLHEV